MIYDTPHKNTGVLRYVCVRASSDCNDTWMIYYKHHRYRASLHCVHLYASSKCPASWRIYCIYHRKKGVLHYVSADVSSCCSDHWMICCTRHTNTDVPQCESVRVFLVLPNHWKTSCRLQRNTDALRCVPGDASWVYSGDRMFYCKHHTSRDVPLLVRSGDRWEWSAKKTNKYGIRKNTNKSKDFVQAMMALYRGEQFFTHQPLYPEEKASPVPSKQREGWA